MNPPKPVTARLDDIEAKLDKLLKLKSISTDWLAFIEYASKTNLDPNFLMALAKRRNGES